MPLQLSGSLQISGSVTAETIVLSSTASLAGTASWAINVVNGGGGGGSVQQFFYTSSQAPNSASLETYFPSNGTIYLVSQSISITGSATTFIGDSGVTTLEYWYECFVYDEANSKWWVLGINTIDSDTLATIYSVQDLNTYWASGSYSGQYLDFPGTTGNYEWYLLKNYATGFQSTVLGTLSQASGNFSTALGDSAIAEGESSVALGANSLSEGQDSTALGNYARSSGQGSVAVGYLAKSAAQNSVSIGGYGSDTLASGSYSVAINGGTTYGQSSFAVQGMALGDNSRAIGGFSGLIGIKDPNSTDIFGETAIVSGVLSIPNSIDYSTLKFGNQNSVQGYGTLMYQSRQGFNLQSGARYTTKYVPYCSMSFDGTNFNVYLGTRDFASDPLEYTLMTDYNDLGIGFTDAAFWFNDFNTGIDDKVKIGQSISLGRGYSYGVNSVDAGGDTYSAGQSSFTNGGRSVAQGDFSHAEGYQSYAFGEGSHADGYLSFAVGNYSKAEGTINFTSNYYTNIVRWTETGITDGTIEVSDASQFQVGDRFAFVNRADDYPVTSNLAVRLGYIIGKNSNYLTCSLQPAFLSPGPGGYSNLYEPDPAFVNWPLSNSGSIFNLSSGSLLSGSFAGNMVGTGYLYSGSAFSKAEGFYTLAANFAANAQGGKTAALGKYSHTEGYYNVAYGDGAHAEGYGTVASGAYQHVQGQFNVSSSGQSAFIIGNGTSDTNRSNLVFASGSTFQVTGSVTSTGGFTGSLFGTASFSTTASYLIGGGAATVAQTGSTVYTVFDTSDISTSTATAYGISAGKNTPNASSFVAVGYQAGLGMSNSNGNVVVGSQAGGSIIEGGRLVSIGFQTGTSASYSEDAVLLGTYAGYRTKYHNRGISIGYSAGEDSVSGSYSVFLGYYAGRLSQRCDYSVFIGNEAGAIGNIGSSGSIMIGQYAGRASISAANCIFIGRYAGWNSTYHPINNPNAGPKRNNIVIGNYLTLSSSYENGVNIGGLIFGSGSYSGQTMFSGSANGRIGINQPNPQYSLDVSGSIGLSDVLVVATRATLPVTAPTGSIMASGSGADNKPYYWNGATWTALF